MINGCRRAGSVL